MTPACSHANIVPGAAEAGRDLVADEERAVPRAAAQPAQVRGRMDPHAGGALHERLDDQRRELAGRARRASRSASASAAASAAVGVACRAASGRRAAASGARAGATASAKKRWNALRVADADRAERVAVIRLDERREARAPRVAAQLLVLERDPERGLDGGRAGVRVEDARQAGRRRSRRARARARSPARRRGRAASSARPGRAARGAPRRASGGGARARCTRATRRRRGSGGRAASTS